MKGHLGVKPQLLQGVADVLPELIIGAAVLGQVAIDLHGNGEQRTRNGRRMQYPKNIRPAYFRVCRAITSSTQDSAAETVGKPIVLVSTMIACWTSAGLAPASSALRAWECTDPSARIAAAAASWTSSEVFLFSGPADLVAFPSF